MRKVRTTAATVVAAAGLLSAVAAPALAAEGGNPPSTACGLGKTIAHNAIQNQAGPGASESARVPPAEVGCTGSG